MAIARMRWAAFCIALLLPAVASDDNRAHAYEFEVLARTIGQGYQLRSFRLQDRDLALSRRRMTQTLTLSIWNVGDFGQGLLRRPRIFVTSHLRIHHDFGAWATGRLTVGNQLFDAVDLIPELEPDLVALDVLYAYAGAEGLAGGWFDVYAGRLLEVDSLDWLSFDGVKARARTRFHSAAIAYAGFRTRDSWFAASDTHELDGTGRAQCAEYIEGQDPGSGTWRPIDRTERGDPSVLANDFDRCPQREEIMPTLGAALETSGLDWLSARVGYRIALSPRPGIIGPIDRFEFPDTGLYPNETETLARWGVNEELVSASFDLHRRLRAFQLTSRAALRYNLLLAAVDQAHAGIRLERSGHSIEPEVHYSLPSFDGDSIFNVFNSGPYLDARMSYDAAPKDWPLAGYARLWARRFSGLGESGPAWAAGVRVGARFARRLSARAALEARLDLFRDQGYGGQRTGGHGSALWQITRTTGVRLRASVIHFDAQLSPATAGSGSAVNLGLQGGATYRINHGVTVHIVAEDNRNRFHSSQFRVLGLVDLAFVPEV